MSQEPEEDVKPKLNINVVYDGTQITVKVKANMRFQKIFDAAEKRFGKEPGTFKFTFEGKRVQKDDTPTSIGMEDGDIVDAFLEQVFVSWSLLLALTQRLHQAWGRHSNFTSCEETHNSHAPWGVGSNLIAPCPWLTSGLGAYIWRMANRFRICSPSPSIDNRPLAPLISKWFLRCTSLRYGSSHNNLTRACINKYDLPQQQLVLS
ncbi:hypothetical protein BD779DRAFT_1444412 [Infundibulicybe gibba]|nr:hypothetical protein BD779DRAFT_1444412 [Infundibulicybe gibba]